MTTQPEALRLADALTTPPDCTCRATSYFECGCDAIWPEQWIDHATAELRRLHAENERLRTVMVAAAEEIAEHWEAHCDAEGYGPVNLMRRLEEGIAAEYGYTAGEFARLRSQRDALLEALKLIVEFVDAPTEGKRPDVFVMRISKARAAIKAAEEKE